MGVGACYQDRRIRELNGGKERMLGEVEIEGKGEVIKVNLRDEEEDYQRTMIMYGKNTLRQAIEKYQKLINKVNFKIQKAIYEPNQSKLPLDKCLNRMDIDYSCTIIVFFCNN